MAQHARLKIEAGVRVYFCDPHSPSQRGTNENTNPARACESDVRCNKNDAVDAAAICEAAGRPGQRFVPVRSIENQAEFDAPSGPRAARRPADRGAQRFAWASGRDERRRTATLAAIRMLFDWLVTGQVVATNPAHSVRGPKHVVKTGKTTVLTGEQARELLDSIDTSTVVGLRDRALISVMTFAFARIGAVVAMRVEDYYPKGKRWWVTRDGRSISPRHPLPGSTRSRASSHRDQIQELETKIHRVIFQQTAADGSQVIYRYHP